MKNNKQLLLSSNSQASGGSGLSSFQSAQPVSIMKNSQSATSLGGKQNPSTSLGLARAQSPKVSINPQPQVLQIQDPPLRLPGAQTTMNNTHNAPNGKPVTNGMFQKSSNARPMSAQPTPNRNQMLTFDNKSSADLDRSQDGDNKVLVKKPFFPKPPVIPVPLTQEAIEKFDASQDKEPGGVSPMMSRILKDQDEVSKQQLLSNTNVDGQTDAQTEGQPGIAEEEAPQKSGIGADSIVVFINEKELRDHFSISHKIEQVAGVLVKVKKLNDQGMENLLYSISQSLSVVNLKFEETVFTRNACTHLANFLKQQQKLEMLGLIQVRFEDQTDHLKVLESISFNQKLKTLHLQQNAYYDPLMAAIFGKIITQAKGLKDLDFSWCDFRNNLLFKQIMESLSSAKIVNFKLRGFQIGLLEGKILQLFVSGCRYLQTLDLQHSYGKSEHFNFLHKFGTLCLIKQLNIDSLETDLTPHLGEMGKTLADNLRLENISMRESKAKASAWVAFWVNIMPNKRISVLNLERCKINDRVAGAIADYLTQDGIVLQDLNLTRNIIAAKGIVSLSLALSVNKSLKKLNLTRNALEDEGLDVFAASLIQNSTLENLNLAENLINNPGLTKLSRFLEGNRSIRELDLSRNAFGILGLKDFCDALPLNGSITELNLSKNKDINEDEEEAKGIKGIADSIRVNCFVQTLDLTGLRLPKPIIKQNFLPALQDNIFLQKIIGKISTSVLNEELADNEIIERDLIPYLVKDDVGMKFKLNLKNKRPELLKPALKLIRCQNLEAVDLTCMQLTDDQMKMIASFIGTNPALKKLILTQNVYITDYGMILLIDALRKNFTLQHLSILGCTGISNMSLETMHELVRDQNMTLFKLDIDQHDTERLDTILAMQVVKEAFLNKSIQRNLKPVRKDITHDMYTIQFEEDADIAEYFDSVLKCWRIMRPSQIEITNKNLEDKHIVAMSNLIMEYLSKSMMQIILRRNKIGDEGAEALAKYIARNEKNFTYLEISRNQITKKGGDKMLQAMRKNTRVTTLLIDFGNQIDNKQGRKIEEEVKANSHIGSVVKPSLVPDPTKEQFGTLSIQDKGRQFLRCALKSVSELSILHLELSDNLLTYSEAKKIANVLKLNPPLRVLNLRKNLLCKHSAEELSGALIQNRNLLEINLSNNRIGDKGVAIIVLPIAKQRLTFKEDSKAVIRIVKLDLSVNDHTEEALKHVYALLFANKDIVIEINNPKKGKLQAQSTLKANQVNPLTSQQTQSPLKLSPKKSAQFEGRRLNPMGLGRYARNLGIKYTQSPTKNSKIVQDTSKDILLEIQQKRKAKDKKEAPAAADTSVQGATEKEQLIKPVQTERAADPKEQTLALNDIEALLPHEEGPPLVKAPTLKSLGHFICGAKPGKSGEFFAKRFWRDWKANQVEARMFKCNENILSNVESVSQKYITVFIYLSVFFFYLTALLIPMTERTNSCQNGHEYSVFFYYAIYASLSGILEVTFAVYLQKKVDDKEALSVNKFHLWKIISGQLGRADFFTDVLFMMQMYSCQYWPLLIVGILCLVLSSSYQFFMLFRLLKKDEHQLLENIERNCKLAYVTEHHCLAVILDSFSLSNFESVGEKTITVPKIISSMKSGLEDLPQFVIQVVFVLYYSKGGQNNQTSVVVSILLGLISFGMSLNHAIQAKTSNVDMRKIEDKLRVRKEEKALEFDEKILEEKQYLLNAMKEGILRQREEWRAEVKEKEMQGFSAKLSLVEGKRSVLINGLPMTADGQGVPGHNQSPQKSRPMSAYMRHQQAEEGRTVGETSLSKLRQAGQGSPIRGLGQLNQQQKTVAVLGTLGGGKSPFLGGGSRSALDVKKRL